MTPDSSAQLGKLAALLFMMMGPIAVMPGFAMLTTSADPGLTRRIAMRAALYAAIAVVLAVLLGYTVLTGWGASAPSLIIAAGVLLLLSSLGHVLAKPEMPAAAPAGTPPPPPLGIALSPLAFPMIVTPPAIGVLVIFTAYFRDSGQQLFILATGLGIVLLDLLAMLAARRVMGWIGMVPLRILGAVFGVLQVALAVEFIINGIARSKLLT
jgi:multiple antibiotic resistance protein